MLDRAAVLAKTSKGLEEVKSRTHGVPQKLRTLLIMVDGTATVGDVLARFPGIAEIETNLETLVAQGFLEAKGGGAAATPAPAAASAAAPAATAVPAAAAPAVALPATADEALRMLARKLYDTMGPAADMITGDVERARTATAFADVMRRVGLMLDGTPASRAKGFRDLADAVRAKFFAG
ncbi:MAG: hypothetical protein MUF79_12090 [Burkholderiales bacterium]|jgi:pyruvate/2-oxoglutarate dehydrogenase complex dihydrolipoamide acyltransferase (E2) component|nr:hypothetical protein [Burkholderiales bacterium]